MITATITNGSLTVTGHARRASGVPPGNNIICAAVSALTLTLAEALQEVAGAQVEVKTSHGDVSIFWVDMTYEGQVLLDAWLLGMHRIQESYGEILITEQP